MVMNNIFNYLNFYVIPYILNMSVKETSGCMGTERVNKWPNSMKD